MVTSLHFAALLLQLTHLEGSPENTQEKLELLGLHGKGRVRSRMVVVGYNKVIYPISK